MGGCGVLGRQTVFHQPDVHAAGPNANRLGVFVGSGTADRRIAQGYEVHTVDGNLMFGNQIALDGLSQPLRALDTGRTCARRVCFDFNDVALVTGEVGREVIELAARSLGKDGCCRGTATSTSLIWWY